MGQACGMENTAELSAENGVGNTGLRKAGCTDNGTAGPPEGVPLCVRVVTAVRQAVIKAELDSCAYDVGFRELLKGGVQAQTAPAHAPSRGQRPQALEGLDEFGTTVWISRVIERIHSDKNVI